MAENNGTYEQVVERLNYLFSEGNYHKDVRLLSFQARDGYILIETLVQNDVTLSRLVGIERPDLCVRNALQFIPSTVLQISRDRKFIRRVSSQVRIIRYLDNIFKDLTSSNCADILDLVDRNTGCVLLQSIMDARMEFREMAWGDVRQIASACLRGR